MSSSAFIRALFMSPSQDSSSARERAKFPTPWPLRAAVGISGVLGGQIPHALADPSNRGDFGHAGPVQGVIVAVTCARRPLTRTGVAEWHPAPLNKTLFRAKSTRSHCGAPAGQSIGRLWHPWSANQTTSVTGSRGHRTRVDPIRPNELVTRADWAMPRAGDNATLAACRGPFGHPIR